jgi:hypothetical protein
MPSLALLTLLTSLDEIDALQRANPSPTGAGPGDPAITRAIGRGSIVLLSSHFERYHYALCEELVQVVNDAGLGFESVPILIRLRHSANAIDDLSKKAWDRRAEGLAAFLASEGALWGDTGYPLALEHSRLLTWMKSPKPQELVKAYRSWGIADIFSAVTRKPTTRAHLWLHIDGLVTKRNNIAHGDPAEETTQADVRRYAVAVRTFCERVDRRLASHLESLGCPRPW